VVIRDTGTLVAAAHAQREVTDGIERLLDPVTGQAEDPDGTVAALVGARGELRDLWLREDAAGWGPERLGELIVQTAQAAAHQATQRAYDALAPLLGDTITAAMEGIGPTPPPCAPTGDADARGRGGRASDVRLPRHGAGHRPDRARTDRW
jgi:hypothetical protein